MVAQLASNDCISWVILQRQGGDALTATIGQGFGEGHGRSRATVFQDVIDAVSGRDDLRIVHKSAGADRRTRVARAELEKNHRRKLARRFQAIGDLGFARLLRIVHLTASNNTEQEAGSDGMSNFVFPGFQHRDPFHRV